MNLEQNTGCPLYQSPHIVKAGKSRQGTQRWLCRSCKRRFVHFDALPQRQIPIRQIADALSMFYDGMSYRDIQRNFEQNYDFRPSTATLYEWVRDFTQRAKSVLDTHKAKTGNVWVADEMMTRIDGKQTWIWSVLDRDSRYLLSTHISRTRTIRDARTLFTKAAQRSQNVPTHIITDGLPSLTCPR